MIDRPFHLPPTNQTIPSEKGSSAYIIYGPRQITMAQGQVVRFEDSFSIPLDASGPYTLRILNGSQTQQGRIVDGRVRFNHDTLVSQKWFGQGEYEFTEGYASLPGANVIKVDLDEAETGGSGYVTVMVEVASRAQLASVDVGAALQGSNVAVTLHGTDTHWSNGSTEASFGSGIQVGGATGATGPNHHGLDTVGVYDAATGAFFLRNSNTNGQAHNAFFFGPSGNPGLLPVSGDWDGDGFDTVGVYDSGTSVFYLKNTNAPGNPDEYFQFGASGMRPVVGDWDGDGLDTVGVYNSATGAFFLTNVNEGGDADETFVFGASGPDREPVAGDWDGDGDDSIGIFEPGSSNGFATVWFLKNDNTFGSADLQFAYGMPDAQPMVGDWDGDGDDTVGVRNPPSAGFFLRNSNTPGPGSIVFIYGASGTGLRPLAGDWDGISAPEFGHVQVINETTAIAQVSVNALARLGQRNITVRSSGVNNGLDEVSTLVDGFRILPSTPLPASGNVVSTLIGVQGEAGFVDGPVGQAKFNNPTSIAVGFDGRIYVADTGNHAIRVVNVQAATPYVYTLAGDGTPGYANGDGDEARFNSPQGITVDDAGNIFVADTKNHRIRQVSFGGTVTTVAGTGATGFDDGQALQATFNLPKSLAVDSTGVLFISDTRNERIRKLENGTVTVVATEIVVSGIAVDGGDVYAYITNNTSSENSRIDRIDIATGVITTVSGSTYGFAEGANPRMAEPTGLGRDTQEEIIVADSANSLIRVLNLASQTISTVAGSGARGSMNGAGHVAEFNNPSGLVVLESSVIVVADAGNHSLRRALRPPIVGVVEPTAARPGDTIRIHGLNFDASTNQATQIRFSRVGGGLTAVARIESISRSVVDVRVPVDTASGDVVVTTTGGTDVGNLDIIIDPPVVGRPVADPDWLLAGQAQDVLITAEISYESLFGKPVVSLQQVDETGTVLSTIGVMVDDGDASVGDDIGGDRLFSRRLPFGPQQAGSLYFRILVETAVSSEHSEIFSIEFGYHPTFEEREELRVLSELAFAMYRDQKPVLGHTNAVDAVLQSLESDSRVAHASGEINRSAINFRTTSGLRQTLLFSTMPGPQGQNRGVGNHGLTAQWMDNGKSMTVRSMTPAAVANHSPSKLKAVVAAPVGSDIRVDSIGVDRAFRRYNHRTLEQTRGSLAMSSPRTSSQAPERSRSSLTPVAVQSRKALILAPFPEATGTAAVTGVHEILINATCPPLDVEDVLWGENVTVAVLRNLSQYGFIAVFTHGNTHILISGQTAESDDPIDPVLEQDIKRGRVARTAWDHDENGKEDSSNWHIGDEFIEHYSQRQPYPNSIILLAQCYGGLQGYEKLADTFLERGANTVLSFGDNLAIEPDDNQLTGMANGSVMELAGPPFFNAFVNSPNATAESAFQSLGTVCRPNWDTCFVLRKQEQVPSISNPLPPARMPDTNGMINSEFDESIPYLRPVGWGWFGNVSVGHYPYGSQTPNSGFAIMPEGSRIEQTFCLPVGTREVGISYNILSNYWQSECVTNGDDVLCTIRLQSPADGQYYDYLFSFYNIGLACQAGFFIEDPNLVLGGVPGAATGWLGGIPSPPLWTVLEHNWGRPVTIAVELRNRSTHTTVLLVDSVSLTQEN